MGLSESKVPFDTDTNPSTPQNDKEIGICAGWDPRSPSNEFERTPVFDRNEKVNIRDDDIGAVAGDPRSPSNEITRTPVGVEFNGSLTGNDIDNELRLQMERLNIYDGGIHGTADSTENLGNEFEGVHAVSQQKSVLKLLDDESAPSTIDPFWLPNTPPHPKSRSTPREMTPNSPETPGCHEKETHGLIKRRKASSKKQHISRTTEKLQKKVLKKSLGEQATRSPLAERNGMVIKESKKTSTKAKSTAFIMYRKYNSLDESLTDSIVGKENEQVALW